MVDDVVGVGPRSSLSIREASLLLLLLTTVDWASLSCLRLGACDLSRWCCCPFCLNHGLDLLLRVIALGEVDFREVRSLLCTGLGRVSVVRTCRTSLYDFAPS